MAEKFKATSNENAASLGPKQQSDIIDFQETKGGIEANDSTSAYNSFKTRGERHLAEKYGVDNHEDFMNILANKSDDALTRREWYILNRETAPEGHDMWGAKSDIIQSEEKVGAAVNVTYEVVSSQDQILDSIDEEKKAPLDTLTNSWQKVSHAKEAEINDRASAIKFSDKMQEDLEAMDKRHAAEVAEMEQSRENIPLLRRNARRVMTLGQRYSEVKAKIFPDKKPNILLGMAKGLVTGVAIAGTLAPGVAGAAEAVAGVNDSSEAQTELQVETATTIERTNGVSLDEVLDNMLGGEVDQNADFDETQTDAEIKEDVMITTENDKTPAEQIQNEDTGGSIENSVDTGGSTAETDTQVQGETDPILEEDTQAVIENNEIGKEIDNNASNEHVDEDGKDESEATITEQEGDGVAQWNKDPKVPEVPEVPKPPIIVTPEVLDPKVPEVPEVPKPPVVITPEDPKFPELPNLEKPYVPIETNYVVTATQGKVNLVEPIVEYKAPRATKEGDLPQTGESEASKLQGVAGFGLISAAIGGWLEKRKERKLERKKRKQERK